MLTWLWRELSGLYLWHVHRIDELLVAFLVFVANVIVPWCRGHEHALGYGQVGILKRIAEPTTFTSCGLVRLIEYTDIEPLLPAHGFTHNMGGLAARKHRSDRTRMGDRF